MNSSATAGPIGLLLSDDFVWTSRISGTANALGKTIKAARSMPQLQALAQEKEISCVILDLSVAGLNAATVVQQIRSVCKTLPRITAFGSHVDVAALRAAREAGCDPVLPRSQFAEQLPTLLQEWLAG